MTIKLYSAPAGCSISNCINALSFIVGDMHLPHALKALAFENAASASHWYFESYNYKPILS